MVGKGRVIEPFQEAEVSSVLAKLKNGKSAGGNWVTVELVKGYKEDQLAPILTRMFNIFRYVGLPQSWNDMLLVPIHKKGDRKVAGNYRGIALMPMLAKIFSQCVLKRLEAEAQTKGLRADAQAGFRSHHRVEDNAVILKTIVERVIQRREPLWVCFVDLEKAYDRVSRPHLWAVLEEELGVSGELVEQVKQMYNEVSARVVTVAGKSKVQIPIEEGVK